eukprot:325852-Pyramimonas_sp.AAC.1
METLNTPNHTSALLGQDLEPLEALVMMKLGPVELVQEAFFPPLLAVPPLPSKMEGPSLLGHAHALKQAAL